MVLYHLIKLLVSSQTDQLATRGVIAKFKCKEGGRAIVQSCCSFGCEMNGRDLKCAACA
jgi:hypothetical protein